MPTPPSDLDPAADDHLPPPPIPVLPLALLVWMISQAASAIAFTAVAEPGDTLTDLDGTEIFLAVLPLQVILLLGSFAIVAPHGAVMQRLRLTRWSPRELALGFLMGVGAQIVIGVVYRPILEAFDQELNAAQDLAAQFSGSELILLALMTSIGAPVAEEVFYRGLVQGSLERTGRTGLAIVFTAFVFAASHFQLLEGPALFLFGLVAGWWCHRTGKVSAAIAFHVGFNALSTVVLIADQV